MLINSTFRRLKQEGGKFKSNLGYIGRSCFKTQSSLPLSCPSAEHVTLRVGWPVLPKGSKRLQSERGPGLAPFPISGVKHRARHTGGWGEGKQRQEAKRKVSWLHLAQG